MAYQALYRKWRPQTFDIMVGATLALRLAITKETSHAYLFTGPRQDRENSTKVFAKANLAQTKQTAEAM